MKADQIFPGLPKEGADWEGCAEQLIYVASERKIE